MRPPLVKVTSPTFSKHPVLKAELAERLPNVVFNEAGARLRGAALVEYLAGADGAVIGLEPVDAEVLALLPELRFISKYGVGLDNLDLECCKARGVGIGWTGGTNKRSVSEQTLCFMIGLVRNVFVSSATLRAGAWRKEGGRLLSTATVGIVGLGHVGKDVARLLQPFGCRVLANDVVDVTEFCAAHDVIEATKDQIWREADVVTLHVPLTPETRHLIDAATIAKMKEGAYLVNTSRGEVVKLSALKEALVSGRLGGAALDVFEVEPPDDRELLALPNLLATPHIGGNADEAVLEMGRSAIRHLCEFFGA